VKPYKLDSLRILGSVGEPINPEAWVWYHEVVGRKKCAIVDTYWQTESGISFLSLSSLLTSLTHIQIGGHLITPLPGAIKTKAGSATVPFFGIDLAILDPQSGKRINETVAEGVLAVARPWPGIARTVYKDHTRFLFYFIFIIFIFIYIFAPPILQFTRYLQTYMQPYPGYYFSGDGVSRDADGYYWISGRIDGNFLFFLTKVSKNRYCTFFLRNFT
jgi:acetyl-CoA synthetase